MDSTNRNNLIPVGIAIAVWIWIILLVVSSGGTAA